MIHGTRQVQGDPERMKRQFRTPLFLEVLLRKLDQWIFQHIIRKGDCLKLITCNQSTHRRPQVCRKCVHFWIKHWWKKSVGTGMGYFSLSNRWRSLCNSRTCPHWQAKVHNSVNLIGKVLILQLSFSSLLIASAGLSLSSPKTPMLLLILRLYEFH